MFILWDTLRTWLRLFRFGTSKWSKLTWLYTIFFKSGLKSGLKSASKMQTTLFTNPHAPQASYNIAELKVFAFVKIEKKTLLANWCSWYGYIWNRAFGDGQTR